MRAFTREEMPVLLLDDAASLLDLVDMAAPAIADGADVAVESQLAVGAAAWRPASKLNQAMIVEDGESVAA